MKKHIKNTLFALGLFVLLVQPVSAQGFLPDPIQNLFNLLGPGGEGSSEFVTSRVSALLLIFLGVIILAAVVYTALAALKYIQSRGDEGEVQEARKGIEAIFQGIALMLIAIVGIVLVFVFFGAELFAPNLYQTCVSAPNSPGCNACSATDGGLIDTWDDAKFESNINDFYGKYSGASGPVTATLPPTVTGIDNSQKCGICEWAYFQASRDNNAAADLIADNGALDKYCTE